MILFEVAQLLAQLHAHKKSGFAIIDTSTDKQWPESKLKTVGA